MKWHGLYRRLLSPTARNEDTRRRELILNILLVGIICLNIILFAITVAGSIIRGAAYGGTPPLEEFIVVAIFVLFLFLSRKGFHRLVAYLFTGIFFLLATWPTVVWGILLPQGILTYSLVIVMSGVLLSSRVAFYITLLMFLTLLTIAHLADVGTIHYDTKWMLTNGSYGDVIAYGFTFGMIALVAWLSNREIERSLGRALVSEKALIKEQRSLESKVRERTEALEKAQVEKMMNLQRFAEFGRLSSTLLHELTNPLVAVSLELEQIEGKNRSEFVSRAREGIAHMEQYVETARRQLRNESEIRLFDIAGEIKRVAGFLEPKAKARKVHFAFELVEAIDIKGDSIRFDHIISNLLSNAIDAYDDVKDKMPKIVSVKMAHTGQTVEITVADHGGGITKTQLAHLFEPFYTTKQISRGTGLGLAIAKNAVEEAFQGTISASYSKQRGTLFVVKLPLG